MLNNYISILSEFGILQLLCLFLFYYKTSPFLKGGATIILCFSLIVIDLQFISLYFTGEYISKVALTNIGEAQSIGKMLYTILALFFAIIFIFYIIFLLLKKLTCNIFQIFSSNKKILYLSVLFIILLVLDKESPTIQFYKAVSEVKNIYTQEQQENIAITKKSLMKENIYIDDIANNPLVNQKFNVVLIFVEGMSSKVLDKNSPLSEPLSSNLDSLINQSYYFENYYNHTAATFRGIRGQLTSFYQLKDGDLTKFGNGAELDRKVNDHFSNKLISLPQILSHNGYDTSFISTDGQSSVLTSLAKTIGFNQVYTTTDFFNQDVAMSDAESIDALTRLSQKKSIGKTPFFISIYTRQTHFGMDSGDNDYKYNDGNNSYYNKFFNMDQQIGKYIDFFMKGTLKNNTLLIITADHATFPDPDYKKSFNSNAKYFIDEIPLIIYYKGVQPKIIDANGSNSLSLAPTILHLLGIKHEENMFLGCSLFDTKCQSDYSHLSVILNDLFNTSKTNGVERIKNNELMKRVMSLYEIGG